VIGHGALFAAAGGILVAAHAGRPAGAGATSSSRGEREYARSLAEASSCSSAAGSSYSKVANITQQLRTRLRAELLDWRLAGCEPARTASAGAGARKGPLQRQADGGPLVFVDEAAEHGPALDPLPGEVGDGVVWAGRAAAMRSSSVVVGLVLG
jgi:hypothetical protein